MIILLVIGVMDLRMMAVVAAAITAERLAPAGMRVARHHRGPGRRGRVVSHRPGSILSITADNFCPAGILSAR